MIRRVFRHRQITHYPKVLLRGADNYYMAMPTARPMREPGTNYLTYITADGPVTYHAGA